MVNIPKPIIPEQDNDIVGEAMHAQRFLQPDDALVLKRDLGLSTRRAIKHIPTGRVPKSK